MSMLKELNKKLAELEKAEDQLFEQKQFLYKKIRDEERKEKEEKFKGKPQLFMYDGGYGGDYYIAATSKEDAIRILLKKYPKIEDAETNVEALGTKIIHFECESSGRTNY